MKSLYLLFLSFFFPFAFMAQETIGTNPTFSEGDFAISYAFAPGFQVQHHQLTVDYFFNDSWSLVYRANASVAQSSLYNTEYVVPLGATVGIGAASLSTCGSCSGYCSFDDGLGLIAASFMIPDGVSYHIYPMKNVAISPYFIFSGLGIFQSSEDTEFFYSPSGGIRFSLSSRTFPFGAYLDPQMRLNHDGLMAPQVLGGLMFRF